VTDDQIEVLRTLVNYAHQRRSWNDETIGADRYYLPSDEDWDVLEAVVADLEDKLMSQCDFVTLDDTNDRLGVGTDNPAIMLDVQATEQSIARFQYTDGHGLIVSATNPELSASDVAIIDAPHTALMDHDLEILTVLGASGGQVGIDTVSPNSRLDVGAGAITLAEMTPPGGTPANMCVLFVKDDGTGKTALIAKFNSVARVLATE
jgi:hypothetical protein